MLILQIAGGIVVAVMLLALLAFIGLAVTANWEACGPMFAALFLIVAGWALFEFLPALLGWAFVLFVVASMGAGLVEAVCATPLHDKHPARLAAAWLREKNPPTWVMASIAAIIGALLAFLAGWDRW
jgi:hypothetical protein